MYTAAQLRQAQQDAIEHFIKQSRPICWFKHGPYDDGEPLQVVFDDPCDDACYTPLIAQQQGNTDGY